MFTPQEVQEKRFSKAMFNGYDMGEVDDFLDPLSEDYAALYKENALLKSKMKVLVEKIEEYRSTEESMKKALRSARSMAAEIVEDARKQSAAPGLTPEDVEALRREADAEEARLAAAKRRTAAFAAEIGKLLSAEAVRGDVPAQAAFAPKKPADHVDTAVRDIDDSLSKIVADTDAVEVFAPAGDDDADVGDLIADIRRETEEMERQAEARLTGQERKPRYDDPELEETRPRFDFTNLQFGKDYEIKK